jgi:N4-gp56 family major capsid protein
MAAGTIGNWNLDITDGVLKNHDISNEILHASYEKCRAMEFVKVVPFGKNRGQSVTVPRVHAITEPEDASLEELGSIPEDAFSISGTKITVAEYARVLPYTSLEEELLSFDLEVELQDLLREQMTLVLDTLSIAAFKLAKIYATMTNGTTISFATGGAPTAVAGSDLNVYTVEEVMKYLIETLYAPPYDEDYVCLARYRSLLAIRKDVTYWQPWHVYTDPESKYNGEVGRLERCRFVETNHSKALKNMGPAGAYTQAVFFGKDAVAMAETTPAELRAGIPSDLGRKKIVGWYMVAGWNIRWETANAREARVVMIDGLAA